MNPNVLDQHVPILRPEDYPNIDDLVIEDGKPVDSIFVEKQQRLLTEPLYSSWTPQGDVSQFLVASNVGLFFALKQPPLVPDVMLSLEVEPERDLSLKENRSYLCWVIGKMPDVVIEIVSDRLGGEASHKMREYARRGIPYYAIFDPFQFLDQGVLRLFGLREKSYLPLDGHFFPAVGLGLTLWQGKFEMQEACWLRWCDEQGRVIPTGKERADQERPDLQQERRDKEQAQRRAERLAEQLRALGIEPVE